MCAKSLDQNDENLPRTVIVPAFYNSHTHVGDSCLPDGAAGLTVEEAFFRPNGGN